MSKLPEVGSKFHMLTVIRSRPGYGSSNKPGRVHALTDCICDCGKKKTTQTWHLVNMKIKSCGCLNDDKTEFRKRTVERCTKHGASKRGKLTTEYLSWCSMRNRCQNKSNKDYGRYGGRGITVCDRWMESFNNFFDDMGKKPSPKHSLDRINNHGNYEPSNCRWATQKEQVQNSTIFTGKYHIRCASCGFDMCVTKCHTKKKKYCSISCAGKGRSAHFKEKREYAATQGAVGKRENSQP